MTKSTHDIIGIISPILKGHGIKRASLFGSTARGDNHDSSDIDILFEFKDSSLKGLSSIARQVELQEKLESATRKKVDLVEYSQIKKNLVPYINSDLVSISL